MEKKGFIFLIILGFFLISPVRVFASVNIGKNSIVEKIYNTGETLKGSVNISLNNEPAENIFRAIFKLGSSETEERGKKLKEMLDESQISYRCNPTSCKEDYTLESTNYNNNPFTLQPGQEKLLAFKIAGEFHSISFDVDVSNEETCSSPIKIDIFNDGRIELEGNNVTGDYDICGARRIGCFNPALIETEDYATLGQEPYCEKIILSPAPKYKLGAWLRGSGTEEIEMELYSLEGESLASCEITESIPLGGGFVGCEIDYLNQEEKGFYVCVKSELETSGYEIKMEDSSSPKCGFFGFPQAENVATADYLIYAAMPRYGNTGKLNPADIEEYDLNSEVQEYLDKVYNNNCTAGNPCKVPLKFISKGGANVKINASVVYRGTAGLMTKHEVFGANILPLTLTSNFSMIDLKNLGIKVPLTPGNYTMKLFLGNSLVNETGIKIERVRLIKNLYPRFAALKNPMTFYLETLPGITITNYNWNFGDGQTATTTKNSVEHTYNSSGIKTLSVTITTSDGRTASESFNITVGTPRESANYTLQNYRRLLVIIDSKISNFPQWTQSIIKEKIKYDQILNQINTLQQRYNQATTESVYIEILNNLSTIRMPLDIFISGQGQTPYPMRYSEIEPDKFEKIGAGDAEEGNKEGIGRWVDKNLDLILDFKIIDAIYESGRENVGGIFKFKMVPKEEKDAKNFILFYGDIKFKDPGQQNLNGSFGLVYDNLRQREIEFFQSGIESFNSIKIYVSPEFSALSQVIVGVCNYNKICEKERGEKWKNCSSDCRPWGLAFLIFFFILGIFGAVGFFMWKWYKNEYENRLFKDKTQLYNIISFIKTSKTKGLSKGEIYARLKKEGWNNEQIAYAMMQIEDSIWAKIFFKKSTIEKLESLGLPIVTK